jgi:anti-sigma-K factor RskA
VTYELRAKRPDLDILSNVHERAIAEAAKRRASSEAGAEEALRLWWASYVDSMVCYAIAQALICAYSSRLDRDATMRPWSGSYPCFDVQ